VAKGLWVILAAAGDDANLRVGGPFFANLHGRFTGIFILDVATQAASLRHPDRS
jgi:hypothetical protein